MNALHSARLAETFQRALGDILARVAVLAPASTPPPTAIAVAYSGGLDSSALLQLTHAAASQQGLRLFAFHIHHGLSPNADSWQAHCAATCERLGITFEARRIQLDTRSQSGTEEAARLLRYAALGALCRAHQVPLLLTAHHQDDQAETVLLQLLRGSGVAGLSGMDQANHAPDLLGDAQLLMGRPLLEVARPTLEDFVRAQKISHIEDESNADQRYARNALRHAVMPVIEGLFPGFAARFARTAMHAQSAQRLLIDMAAQDLALCLEGERLALSRLRQFGAERIDNLLRYWFGTRGVRMPSTAWLHELRTQLLEAKPDAQLCVTHADCELRRHRDYVMLCAKSTIDPELVDPQQFSWQGEDVLHFPHFGGRLHFVAAEEGVDAAWLQNQLLTIHYRSGGERLKLAANRPTKSLKHLCQALDIPSWERRTMIIVESASQILYAAQIGMDCGAFSAFDALDAPRIRLDWQAD